MNVRYVLISQIYRPISTIRYKKNPSDTIKKKKKIQYSILEPCLNRYKSNIVILNECVCVCVNGCTFVPELKIMI